MTKFEQLNPETKAKVETVENKHKAVLEAPDGKKPEDLAKAKRAMERVEAMKKDEELSEKRVEEVLNEIEQGKEPEQKKQLTPEEELDAKIAKATGITKLVLTIQKFMGKFMEMLEGFKDSLLDMGSASLKEMAALAAHVSPELAKFLNEVANSEKGTLRVGLEGAGFALRRDANKSQDIAALNQIKAAHLEWFNTPKNKEALIAEKNNAALEAWKKVVQPAPPAQQIPQPKILTESDINSQSLEAELKQKNPFEKFMKEKILSENNLARKEEKQKWRERKFLDGTAPVITLSDVAALLQIPDVETAPAPAQKAPEAPAAPVVVAPAQPPAAGPAGTSSAAVSGPTINAAAPQAAQAKPSFSPQFNPPKK